MRKCGKARQARLTHPREGQEDRAKNQRKRELWEGREKQFETCGRHIDPDRGSRVAGANAEGVRTLSR